MKTLLLSAEQVRSILGISRTLGIVEEAFRDHGRGEVQMPPKLYLDFTKHGGDLRVMPAFIPGHDAAGVKIVNVHPRNHDRDLPTVMASIVLNDPATGFPVAIMDGTHITNMRTGAGGGVAAKHLARKDSRVVGLVGAGMQARTQLAALMELFSVEEVKVWSRDTGIAFELAAAYSGDATIEVEVVPSIEEACRADIVCTTTPSREPLVEKAWISPGTHINAIGADAAGKRELGAGILNGSKVVCDAWEQARHSGEINVPVTDGSFKREDLYAEIGEIIAGFKPGRTTDDEITVFDSTGLAIQDIAVARYVYQVALDRGIGLEFDLIGLEG